MKPPQFVVAVILSLVPLVLVINLIFMEQKNESLQTQLQNQQVEINKGAQSRQIGVSLLKDIGQASVKDEKLKEVLTKSGYSVTQNSSPTPAGDGSTPAASPVEAAPGATP